MKKIFIMAAAAFATVSFCSFTGNQPALCENEYGYVTSFAADTVPHKKDTSKRKSGTTPYDSFGKPKKMDTTRLQ